MINKINIRMYYFKVNGKSTNIILKINHYTFKLLFVILIHLTYL